MVTYVLGRKGDRKKKFKKTGLRDHGMAIDVQMQNIFEQKPVW